jgi:hypothetical protein
MNTSLKTASLVFAFGLVMALSAQLCGATLPAAIDSVQMFAGFVASVLLLTVFSDYSRQARSLSFVAVSRPRSAIITRLPVHLSDKRLAA